MNSYFKILVAVSSMLALGACASSGNSSIRTAKTPAKITYAPAIDVAYDEVQANIADHIGVNVRWGGQVIEAHQIGETTQLTVFAYPLNGHGKPDSDADAPFKGGRFAVELDNDIVANTGYTQRFITVYGPISGELIISNGPLQKVIPVVTAEVTTEWSGREGRRYSDYGYYGNSFGYAYHGLGFRYSRGHLGGARYGFYASPYYGYHYSYSPRRGHHRRH